MSSSASLPSSTSPPSAPPAASAASTPFIAYELRDGSNGYASLAGSAVELPPSALILHLQQAVFAANVNKLRGRDYTDLDVYPPGSSSLGASVPARPRDSIASVLAKATVADDDTLIIVARPLPATAGVHGEQRLALQHIANVQAASATVSPALLMIVLLLLCRALLCCVRRQRAPHPLSQPSGRGGTRMRSIAPRSRRWTRSWSSSAIDSA